MVNLWHTAKVTSEAARDISGGFSRFDPETILERHFNLRMPIALFQELARQAADRGMPIGAYIRSQLASNISKPTNIHLIKKEKANAS